MNKTETSALEGLFKEEPFGSFADFEILVSKERYKNKNWVFRGARDTCWGLSTSFDRAIKRFDLKDNQRSKLESALIRSFQRRAHQYLERLPERDNWLEWLALMRHHGAPTRLLDWTYSYYIASFFALERATGPCVVWALDAGWLGQQVEHLKLIPADAHDRFKRDKNVQQHRTFAEIWARHPAARNAFVFAANPFVLNERLSVQQGVFLCPGDVSKGFEANLAAMFKDSPADKGTVFVKFKLDFSLSERKEAISRLMRMNVTTASLYPGLDGYARSLEVALARDEILEPDENFPFYEE